MSETKSNPYKKFFLHLLIIILLTIGICTGFFLSLGWITKHGESIKVPNVTGLNSNAAIQKITESGLNPVVLDSAYYDSLPKLSIVSQTPAGGAEVKGGRTVYIIINRAVAPLVQLPDLTGYSLTSASSLLKSFGLKMGDYSYTASPARDAVIKQKIGDSDAVAGTKVPMGTIINLVIGDGSGSEMMTVPNIIGMQLSEAKDYLTSMNCSIGAVTADMDVMHSDSAFIYRQSPSADSTINGQAVKMKMKIGGMIDVWVGNAQPGGVQ